MFGPIMVGGPTTAGLIIIGPLIAGGTPTIGVVVTTVEDLTT